MILGIDPGTATTGYGVIKVPDDILSREYKYDIELITYGNINTPKERLMHDRLHMIHSELDSVIKKYKPDQMVCEMLFFGINSKTAIMVGQARGVIMLAAAQNRLPFQDYTGLQVKLMVAGAGRADKKQVQEAVRKWLGTNGRKRKKFVVPKGGHLDDAADALAIAICHVLKLVSK
ncbi:crossover junction endodeoxyribonuclease RuvC [Candidatus Daviesbacteria bacterium]|nr:crossover junction endodeoxyribonuclease RuvC [Candidatus Daviesbacteria bacterium]